MTRTGYCLWLSGLLRTMLRMYSGCRSRCFLEGSSSVELSDVTEYSSSGLRPRTTMAEKNGAGRRFSYQLGEVPLLALRPVYTLLLGGTTSVNRVPSVPRSNIEVWTTGSLPRMRNISGLCSRRMARKDG